MCTLTFAEKLRQLQNEVHCKIKKLKLFAKNFQKIGKTFQKNTKKINFFCENYKKIAKLAKNFGYCAKNIIQNIFFTSVRYFLSHFAVVLNYKKFYLIEKFI